MPRILAKKKDYKVLDLKGWVYSQMKMHGMNQSQIGEALGVSQPRMSTMLKVPEKDKDRVLDKIDVFTYGDLLTLFELFDTPDEEKIRLLTL